MEDVTKIVARNLSSLIRDSKTIRSYTDLARAAGISERLLYQMVAGNKALSIKVIESVAKAFAVPPWMLLHPDGPPRPPTPSRILATNLRRLMEYNEMDAEQLSKDTRIEADRINAILAEAESPTLEMLVAVAARYGTHVGELLTEDLDPSDVNPDGTTFPRVTRRRKPTRRAS
jgi:transcriptional regulator with XRE-family HTH domain